MKKVFKYIALAAVSAMTLVSCDAFFDSLEGDMSKVTDDQVFSSKVGINRLLANLYSSIPMSAFSAGDKNTWYANASRSGLGYSASAGATFWNYTTIRSINKFIEALPKGVENAVISEEEMKNYKGEALFIRAVCYFNSVKVYGGIPIVTESLDDKYDMNENDPSKLYFPRLTERESWDWVIAQLGEAAELLPEKSTSDMRVNKYTAYAMQARAALWAASVSKYWKKAELNSEYEAVQKKLSYMDAEWANDYYDKCIKAAEKVMKSGKYKLYGYDGTSTPTPADAQKNLEDLFQSFKAEEGLLARSYVSGSSTTGNGLEAKNGGDWGAPHQVTQGYLGGTYSITLNYAEEFDNYGEGNSHVSGAIKTGTNGEIFLFNGAKSLDPSTLGEYKRYDNVYDPFVNKDARFKAWIIYPGCTFRQTFIHMQGGMIMPTGVPNIYPEKNEKVEFLGQNYYPYGGQAEQNSAFYKLPGDVNSHNRTDYCFMVKKYLDPLAFNEYSQSPWYDLRYAEVLLAYAEAYAESGIGDATVAKKALNDIRHRAGFADEVEPTLENILHEYKVEFAFENKWQQILWRRRAYKIQNTTTPPAGFQDLEGEYKYSNKPTLVPVVDLSGDKAQYIFLRTVSVFHEPSRNPGNPGISNVETYYTGIPNRINNHLINNNQKPQE